VPAAAQLGEGQRPGDAAATLAPDRHVAEQIAQLLFAAFGIGVPVGKRLKQVAPVLLSAPDARR
jgi:hypothetical protein